MADGAVAAAGRCYSRRRAERSTPGDHGPADTRLYPFTIALQATLFSGLVKLHYAVFTQSEARRSPTALHETGHVT